MSCSVSCEAQVWRGDQVEDDEDDRELALSLARARRAKLEKKKVESPAAIGGMRWGSLEECAEECDGVYYVGVDVRSAGFDLRRVLVWTWGACWSQLEKEREEVDARRVLAPT
eukprot:1701857-Rhodomonas_salina.1